MRRFSQLAPLDGDWKLSTGDDPRFAAPDFDDCSWRTVGVPGEEIIGVKIRIVVTGPSG